MFDLENGMLVGADAEWEHMHEETPWDRRDSSRLLDFIWDEALMDELLQDTLHAPKLDCDVAEELFINMPGAYKKHTIERYLQRRGLIDRYNEWSCNP